MEAYAPGMCRQCEASWQSSASAAEPAPPSVQCTHGEPARGSLQVGGTQRICRGTVQCREDAREQGSTALPAQPPPWPLPSQDRPVIIIANLKPRNMRGIKSHGMVLCASNEEHTEVGGRRGCWWCCVCARVPASTVSHLAGLAPSCTALFRDQCLAVEDGIPSRLPLLRPFSYWWQVEPLAPPEGAPVGERCWFGEEAEQGEPAKPNQVGAALARGWDGVGPGSSPGRWVWVTAGCLAALACSPGRRCGRHGSLPCFRSCAGCIQDCHLRGLTAACGLPAWPGRWTRRRCGRRCSHCCAQTAAGWRALMGGP